MVRVVGPRADMSRVEDSLNYAAKAWLAVGIGPQRDEPPLHQLQQPLSESRLTLISTGGLVLPGDEPFQTGKLGDSSFREIPVDSEVESLEAYHPHYDEELVERDINVVFPLPLLRELVDGGIVGSLAPTHYSFMGYIPVTRKLERSVAPEVANRISGEDVDLALLVPA